MKWYEIERISPRVVGIVDVTGVRSFLVMGEERALLVDTGTGAGNLKQTVESITSLPYQVVLTHGHVDHAGGAWNFDRVLLNSKDWTLMQQHCTLENQLGYIAATAPYALRAISEEQAIGKWHGEVQPLTDGQVFQLGNLDVEAVAVAGHTQGMTCLLIRQERMMILGDACNGRVFLFDDEASSVRDYRESLTRLLALEDGYDVALFSHGPAVQPKEMVRGCIAVVDEILAGTDDRIPFRFMDKTALLAKQVEADGITRKDGGIGNIVYKNVQK